MPWEIPEELEKWGTTWVYDIFPIGFVHASFEYLSGMSTTNWFSVGVGASAAKMVVALNSSVSSAGKNRSCFLRLTDVPLVCHVLELPRVMKKWLAMSARKTIFAQNLTLVMDGGDLPL